MYPQQKLFYFRAASNLDLSPNIYFSFGSFIMACYVYQCSCTIWTAMDGFGCRHGLVPSRYPTHPLLHQRMRLQVTRSFLPCCSILVPRHYTSRRERLWPRSDWGGEQGRVMQEVNEYNGCQGLLGKVALVCVCVNGVSIL